MLSDRSVNGTYFFACLETGARRLFGEILAEVADKFYVPAERGDLLRPRQWRLVGIQGLRIHRKSGGNYGSQLATHRSPASSYQAEPSPR